MKNLFFILFTYSFAFNQAQDLNSYKPEKISSSYSSRLALVIGNSDYVNSPLKNPANDAKAITVELEKAGFDVLSYTDLDRRGMRNAIHEFGDKLNASKGVGLFYYAGHGLQSQGINYLVPVNAEINREYDIEDECVKANLVLRMMELYENPMNIIILDACRNNPYARSFRSLGRGLAQPESAPIGTIIAFATAPGKTASDGDGENGLYTQELIRAMRIPGLTIERLFKQVRINVLRESNRTQSPWENSSLTGDFYFYPEDEVLVAREDITTTEEPKQYYTFKNITFFETGDKVEDKDFQTSFDKSETRYIYTQINFTNRQYQKSDWKTDFKIKYFKSNGTLWTDLSTKLNIKTDIEDAFVYSGWGWPDQGYWSTGTYKVEVWNGDKKLGEEYFSITGKVVGNYFFKGLKFFEAGDKVTEKDFNITFNQSASRYIYTELNVKNNMYQQTDWKTSFTAKYFNPDGSLFGEPTINSTITTDLDDFTVRTGWGWPDNGNWKSGRYRVEVWDGDQKLGEDYFNIGDEYAETASRNFNGSRNYTFQSVKFFKEGENVQTKEFQEVFDKSKTRYIYAQVNFINHKYELSEWKTDFKIKFYHPDGSLWADLTSNVNIQTDRDPAFVYSGWGWPDYDKWTPGKYRVEVWDGNDKIGEDYFTVSEGSTNNYTFEGLRFFEAGDNIESKTYRTSFAKSTARYIYTEVEIRNKKYGQSSWKINFIAKYYKPDGSIFGDPTIESTIDTNLDFATESTGWGWPDYGNWPVGEYRVEVWDGTIKLGESKFTIY